MSSTTMQATNSQPERPVSGLDDLTRVLLRQEEPIKVVKVLNESVRIIDDAIEVIERSVYRDQDLENDSSYIEDFTESFTKFRAELESKRPEVLNTLKLCRLKLSRICLLPEGLEELFHSVKYINRDLRELFDVLNRSWHTNDPAFPVRFLLKVFDRVEQAADSLIEVLAFVE